MRVLTAVEGGCGAGADRVGVEVEGRRALTLAPPVLGARSLPRPAPPPRRCPEVVLLKAGREKGITYKKGQKQL